MFKQTDMEHNMAPCSEDSRLQGPRFRFHVSLGEGDLLFS